MASVALRATHRPLSTSAAEDVDIDTVAYGFMASQALFTGLETGISTPSTRRARAA